MCRLSIVIETDNASHTSFARMAQLLSALRDQVAAARVSAEILVMHDPARVTKAALDALIAGAGLGPASEPTGMSQALIGGDYYSMKNEGCRLARGELVLLIDSDIVPEPGFLQAMLSPFDDPAIAVVAGSPYVHPRRSLLAKASALYWMFPLRSAGGPLEPSSSMYANTVVVRREVLRAHPFPTNDGYRAQTDMLARELRHAGIAIWRAPGALAAHPPPRSWRAAIERALWEGHDRLVDRPLARQRPATPARAARACSSAPTSTGGASSASGDRPGSARTSCPWRSRSRWASSSPCASASRCRPAIVGCWRACSTDERVTRGHRTCWPVSSGPAALPPRRRLAAPGILRHRAVDGHQRTFIECERRGARRPRARGAAHAARPAAAPHARARV